MANASLTSVLAGMNSIGLFASRAFVSAFAIAALLKWGPQNGWINNTGLLQSITDVPTWFTGDLTVGILGLLALLEIAATKSPDARLLLNEIDGYFKSGVAFLTTLVVSGMITSKDAEVIKQIISWQEPVRAGLGENAFDFIVATFAAAGVWFTCSARRALLGPLMEADPGDDTMLGGLLSWLEDAWALFGTLLLVLFPIVMVVLTAIVLSTLTLLQIRAKRKERKSQVPCQACNQPMYRSAPRCPSCQADNPQVHGISWLGQSTSSLTQDINTHPVRLAQKLRCPVCAAHLKGRKIRQSCPACGHELFESPKEAEAYLQDLDQRVPATLLVTGLLSLIPIVGLIPAVVVYRLRLVSPLQRYTSLIGAMRTRWGLRLLFFILIWVQAIPGLGALAMPVMASINYAAYRRLFSSQLQRSLRSQD